MGNRMYSVDLINNHMALRLPQYQSLQILDDLMNSLNFGLSDAELQNFMVKWRII